MTDWCKNYLRVGVLMTVCAGLWGCGGYLKQHAQKEVPKPPQLSQASSGDVGAQYEVGRYYAQRKRNAKAIYWLCSAGLHGHVDAQLTLARLYEWQGKGPAPGDTGGNRLSNYGSAYFWYTAAASQGSDTALQARDALARKMEAEAVAQARRRATRWRQAHCIKP